MHISWLAQWHQMLTMFSVSLARLKQRSTAQCSANEHNSAHHSSSHISSLSLLLHSSLQFTCQPFLFPMLHTHRKPLLPGTALASSCEQGAQQSTRSRMPRPPTTPTDLQQRSWWQMTAGGHCRRQHPFLYQRREPEAQTSIFLLIKPMWIMPIVPV